MNNSITYCGNIPAQPEMLDEMLPCEGVNIHFSKFLISALPMGYKLSLWLSVNGYAEQWERRVTSHEMESHAGNYWDTDPNQRTEAVLYGIGEILDIHYEQLMNAEKQAAHH